LEQLGAAVHAIGDSTRIILRPFCSTPERHGQQSAVIYTPGVALVASPQYTATPADPSLPPLDLTERALG